MGSVDKVLSELHVGGFSALAGEVPGLRPQKNEPTQGVLELQRRYASVPSSPLTATFTDQVVVSMTVPPPAGTVQVAVTLDIVQAPSAFALPVMQKRPWDPPFQVRMTWRSSLPLQFSTTVAAFAVDEAALPSMLTWQPPAVADAGKALLDHQHERMVVLAPAAADDATGSPTSSAARGSDAKLHDQLGGLLPAAAQEYFAEALFTFQRLSFGAPSQMRPRWLVFAASLIGGGCVYSHYMVPTVVMSRLAEQFEKAKAVLWGSQQPPACDSSVMKMDYRQLRKFIKRELAAIGISREPQEEDYQYLSTRAGFVTSASGVRATSASLQELAAFKEWFGGHVIMLKHILAHYERTEPQIVCGFGVTREQADALLAPHTAGTFLLRFGSQGGQLVLSVRSAGGGARPGGTTHYTIPTAALQSSGLEAVLERNGTAEQLLDAATGLRHLRTAVLDRSYLQAVDMAEVRKRVRRPDSRVSGEEHSAPSPPEPLHSLAAWQQQADSLGRQLAMPSASLAVPQPQGCAAAPLPSCGLLPLGAHEQPVARQHAGNEHSVSSLPSMHQRGQGQLLGGLLPSLVMAGTMPGGLVTAACPAEGPRAGGIAGAGAEALGMLPTSQAASAAAAQNPYSAAGLLLGRGLAAGVAACPSSSAWPMPAAIMAAASPPAAAAQQPPLQLDPSASLPGAGQHTLQASFAWGSLGLAPQLCMRGGQQDAARWPPLTLAPASLAAAAPGTVSHHSTSRASAGSLGGSDDTPSIGPAHGPAVGRQGRQEHSEGGAASGASGSAACSEGAGRSVEPATFQERPGSAAMLAGMVGVPPTMQHKLSGFSSSGLLPPQQQCWVPPHGGGGGGAPLPGWLHGLQLGGAGASGLLSTVDASAMWQPGAQQLELSSGGAAKQEDLLMDLLA